MAHIEYTSAMDQPAPSGWQRFLAAVARGFVAFMEAGPRMDQVRRLNATSDTELAARGTSREREVHRIFGDRMYL